MTLRLGRSSSLIIAILLLGLPDPVQIPGSPLREGMATKVQDNDRVIVWDVIWRKGESTGMRKLDLDSVSVTLREGTIKTSGPDASRIERQGFGTVRFEPKGTIIEEEGVSDTPCREMVFQLKDYVPDPWPVREGIPPQFPRINTVKVLETDRITVWDQVWKPGEPVALHAHYHRTAAVFLVGGTIRAKPENAHAFDPPFVRKTGDVISNVEYSPEAHLEEQVSGLPRAIWIEFKR